ncbi:MAG: hypothetical protein ACKO7P_03225 [Bacteroidota bacterium]
MNYEFSTRNGRQFKIDLTKWKIDEDIRHCKIIEECDDNLVLDNTYGDRFILPEYLIKANEIIVVDNTLELSKGLYEEYFLRKFKSESIKVLDTLYQKHANLIFKNRNIVLNKAEYYLLKPSALSTGFMYSGGIKYSLGSLFESFESGNHIYYDEFCGYREMYLVSMAASPLSGTIFNTTFWSDENKEFINFTNQEHNSKPKLPSNFGIAIGKTLMNMLRCNEMIIDRQDEAIKELIKEVNGGNR